MRKLFRFSLISIMLCLLSSTAAVGQETFKLITFGKDASPTEGDNNNYQVIFLRVPLEYRDSVFLRIFDPDCGGANDQHLGDWNTTTAFALYGGNESFNDELRASINPSRQAVYSGTEIRNSRYSINPLTDNEWITHSGFLPQSGLKTVDGYLFKLVVTGESGDDGNAFEVALSSSSFKNEKITGAVIFSYNPTIRADKRRTDPEIRFTSSSAAEITIGNYDAAMAPVMLETPVRTKVSVQSSGDGNWAASQVNLNEFEINSLCALIIGKGTEFPNDVTVYVKETAGTLLPIWLPVKGVQTNNRPDLKKQFSILADCFSVVFDATQSVDKDKNELSFVWKFGDGNTESGNRVVHKYSEKKSYNASLLVTDNSGAVGSSSYELFQVPINKEPIPVIDVKKILAPDEETVYSAAKSRDDDGVINQFVWEFGDGQSAKGRDVKHGYKTPGKYTVSLKAIDNSISPCNNSSLTTQIWVNAQPKAVAGTEVWISPGQVLKFDGTLSTDPDGKIIKYAWEFGDGRTGTGATTEHAYQKSGFYTVKLTVTDDADVDNSTAEDKFLVKVNTTPVAEAGKDQVVAPDETVYFDGMQSTDSDGSIVKYEWSFGDGAVAEGINVSHEYKKPGTYKVTLKVFDNSGTTSGFAEDNCKITVNSQPTVSIGEDRLLTSSVVQFEGSKASDSDGSIASYEWNFGDGSRSVEKSPLHTYKNPGIYTVRLKVKDNTQTVNNTAEASVKITINAKPVAVAGKNLIGAPDQELFFTARESFDPDGSIVSYDWDFGDGIKADGRDVTHKFLKPGLYKVRLKVADNTNQPDAIDFDEISVRINMKPTAVAGNDIVIVPNQKFTLDGSKSFDGDGEIKKYEWEFFPRGGKQQGAVISNTFTETGVYFAILTVMDNSGAPNAVALDTLRIKVNTQPIANAGENVYTCSMKITFDGSKSSDADGDPLTYKWNFGDGSPLENGVKAVHTYKKGGTYPVILTVDDGMEMKNSQNSAAIKVVINEPPIADAGADQVVCAGEVVRFNASQSKDPEGGALKYTWDLGDGTTAEGINPTKIYKNGGSYQIKLKVEDDSGLPCNTDYDSKVVIVSESPVANAGPDITACANSVIQFDGSKSRDYDGVVNNYSWDFGDGVIGGGAAPTHSFAKAGIYRVVLTITGDVKGDCNNTDTDELIVTIIDAPKADFEVPQNFPVNKPLKLTAAPTVSTGVNITDYIWDFGDGTSAKGSAVITTFKKYGNYFITLTIKTDAKTDCHTASIKKLIVVNEPPFAKITAPVKTGINQPVQFDASKSFDADGSIQVFEWNFGDGSSAKGIIATHRYQTPGLYKVKLKTVDNTTLENNTVYDTMTIRVNSTPVPVADFLAAVCPNQPVNFSASKSTDSDGKIVEYNWDFGDGQTAKGENVTHVFPLTGIYNILLSVDDGDGLSNSRNETARGLQVNSTPEVVVGKAADACVGDVISLIAKKVFDPDRDSLTYKWVVSDGGVVSTKDFRYSFKTAGLYTIRLFVNDNRNTDCSIGTDSTTIYINTPPVANAGTDRSGFTGGAHDEMLFDGSLSKDADGDQLQYQWNFGDGSRGTGEKVYHLFDKPGDYNVTLTVNDGRGTRCSQSNHSIKVTVKNRN